MINEDYVSFEIAKLLKEKGFDEDCFRYAENKKIYDDGDWMVANVTGGAVGVPTLQMAMKWLREAHNLSVDVFHHRDWKVNIKTIPDDYFQADYSYPELKPTESYEEACEAGIKYCLEKLI